MSNIVNPEDRNPLAQAAGRPRPSLNTPMRPGGGTPFSPPATPAASQEELPPTPTELVVDEAAATAEEEDRSSTVAPDWILPSVNSTTQPSSGAPPMRLRPINYENPVTVQIDPEDDETALQRLNQQAVAEGISDDIVHSNAIRERIAASNYTSRGWGYAPVRSYAELGNEIEDIGQRRREGFAAATRPVALNPDQGLLGVGRNVLQGRPFTRTSEQVVDNHLTRLAENGNYQTGIGRWIRNIVPDSPGNVLERAALIAASPARFIQMSADIGRDRQRVERELLATNPEYRTVGRRALEEVGRWIRPAYVNPQGTPTPFVASSARNDSPFLTALAEESPAFRQLMTELAPTTQQANTAPNFLRGEFGEMGSAGAFSAAMYLLNISGGAFTGAIYESTNFIREGLGTINPEWKPPTRTMTFRGQQIEVPTTPNVASPFLGRDSGFTQEYTPDRYLSTIGNPALSWMPRRTQVALGFALDVLADPDGLITRPLRNVAARSVRATAGATAIVDALSNLDNAVLDLPDPRFIASLQQQVVRPTSEGVRSAATAATLPTVQVVEAVPVTVAAAPVRRRAAARGGSIVTVEELLDRVELVTRQIEDIAPAIRQAPEMGIDEGVQAVQRTTRNYELTLQSAVREANLLSTSLTKQDFQAFASNILVRLRNQGVDVTDTGAIQLRRANPTLDALVVPIRAEMSAPLYQNYSDILDIYRQNPTALPPEAYQLVRRDNTAIVNLAKTWEVLPPSATASNARITQLRNTNPEFAHTWGSPIDPNISAPLRRIVEVPESGLMDTPEVSRMVASQPPVTVDATAAPVNQTPPPPDVEQTLRRIQGKYAEEVDRFSSVRATPSQANRAMQRVTALRNEGAQLIADYPEVAARIVAETQPTPATKYPNLMEPATRAAAADMDMRFQHRVLDDLQQQLGIVTRRVDEQQQILDALPPLERRFLDSEIDTRRVSGEDVPIRTVNTPSTISNETVYVAARKELFDNDALLPQNTGIGNDVRTIIENNSELSTLDPDEALELLRSSVELETFNAIDVDTNDILSAAELDFDSLLEFNLDDYLMHMSINELPSGAVFNDNGDMLLLDGTILPRAQVFEAFENAQRSGISYFDDASGQLVIEPMPAGARYIGGGAYGQTYLMPDGSLSKRGSITKHEVRLQRKAAAQGIAPEVLSEQIDPGAAREFSMQFLDGYETLTQFRYKATAPLPTPPPARGEFATNVVDAMQGMDESLRVLDGKKVFISDAHEAYNLTNPSNQLSLDEFKSQLAEANRRREINLSRADMGYALDTSKVAASELNDGIGSKHFIDFVPEAVDTPTGRVLTPDDLYAVELEVYKTVDRLHQAGIVHNDIHSANVMVNPETLDVRIIDFGLATEESTSLGVRRADADVRLDINDPRVSDEMRSILREQGQDYIDATIASRSELDDLFPDLKATAETARKAGYTGDDYEVVAKWMNAGAAKRGQADRYNDAYPVIFSEDLTNDVPVANRNSLTDYGYVASEFGRDVFYHGTHHTSRLSDADVFSLSNEFGPGTYLTSKIERAEAFAKAYPAQDVVTTSMRTPRREQVGNVQAVVTENLGRFGPAKAYSTQIRESFIEELQSRGEARLVRNFKAWIKNNDDPAHWWHYMRERFTDDRMTDWAKIQLGIRDRMIDKGVEAFEGVTKGDYVIINPELIGHRSIPHHVEGTGTVAEALAYRNAVDGELLAALPNNTTRAIDAHNKLNMDTYIQNQLKNAHSEQQKAVLDELQKMHQAQLAHQQDFLNSRKDALAQSIEDLERQTNTVVNMELRNLNDICL